MVFYSGAMTDNSIPFKKRYFIKELFKQCFRLFLNPRGKNVGVEFMINKEVVKGIVAHRSYLRNFKLFGPVAFLRRAYFVLLFFIVNARIIPIVRSTINLLQ